MHYVRKSRRFQLVNIIKGRLAAGEIDKRLAFEIAWLEGLHSYAEQLRHEILNTPSPVAILEPPSCFAATDELKARKATKSGRMILRDFSALSFLMAAKAA